MYLILMVIIQKLKKDFKINKFHNFRDELVEVINWYKNVKNVF